MSCVSDWYTSLSIYTFPTVFIQLNPEEIKSLIHTDTSSNLSRILVKKIHRATELLPGNCFIHADCCAPTDSPLFNKKKGAINSGELGWAILTESKKVRQAFSEGRTKRICLHPYRRMNRMREFRIFIRNKSIVAMSQLFLDRYYPKLEKRREIIWRKASSFVQIISQTLPIETITIDIYLTSKEDLMIIDMNDWGHPTNPLLFKNWDRDWDSNRELKLVSEPILLKGDVSISF